MTNINNGGKSPVAGIIHAVILLLILLFLMPLAQYIPMACLAGVLVIVSYNMSGWRTFKALLKNPKSDVTVLLITFFLQFFPDLIKKGHVYILQTPLFRVRNRKKGVYETVYCYSEEERVAAIERLSPNPEITRFKGLGEISPDEFKHFIGKDMRLEQVSLRKTDLVKELLEFYMGKNTMERQNFIIDNLVVEEDIA